MNTSTNSPVNILRTARLEQALDSIFSDEERGILTPPGMIPLEKLEVEDVRAYEPKLHDLISFCSLGLRLR